MNEDIIKKKIKNMSFEDMNEYMKIVLNEVKSRKVSDDEINKMIDTLQVAFDELEEAELRNFYSNIISRFMNLDQKHRTLFLSNIRFINFNLKKAETTMKQQNCKHSFSAWKYRTWIEPVETVIDHEHVKINMDQEVWERCCRKCKLIESSQYEPEAVRRSRRRKEKDEEIDALKKRLAELEGTTSKGGKAKTKSQNKKN